MILVILSPIKYALDLIISQICLNPKINRFKSHVLLHLIAIINMLSSQKKSASYNNLHSN